MTPLIDEILASANDYSKVVSSDELWEHPTRSNPMCVIQGIGAGTWEVRLEGGIKTQTGNGGFAELYDYRNTGSQILVSNARKLLVFNIARSLELRFKLQSGSNVRVLLSN